MKCKNFTCESFKIKENPTKGDLLNNNCIHLNYWVDVKNCKSRKLFNRIDRYLMTCAAPWVVRWWKSLKKEAKS